MKKTLLAALLCAAMTLTLAGCGEDSGSSSNNSSSDKGSTSTTQQSEPEQQSSDSSDNSESTPESGSSDEIKFPTAAPYAVENLAYTNWTLAGGSENGTEFNEEKFAQVRESFGGSFGIFFETNGKANVIMNYEGNDFSFEQGGDNTTVTLKSGDTTMAGVFTMDTGVLTLMLVDQAKPNITYYLTFLDEK